MNRAPSVLITGCSSGIGRASAQLLRGRGWRVFATARNPVDVEALRAAGFADALRLDLVDPASISHALETVLTATHGTLDALVNNAGMAVPGALEDLDAAALRTQFETNLFGLHTLTRAVIPAMRKQGGGRIVMLSSILGLTAMPLRGAYNASKFALEGYTDSLRAELQGSGIQVSSINPGPIESRFRANAVHNADRYLHDTGSYAQRYARMRREAANPDGTLPFSRPPQAVAFKLVHALEAARPKARYLVTAPAHLLSGLRRLLPAGLLGRLLKML